MHETVREQTVGCAVSECAVISQLTGTISKLCFNTAASQDITGGGMGLGHSKPVAKIQQAPMGSVVSLAKNT